jgi:hypothetical protein
MGLAERTKLMRGKAVVVFALTALVASIPRAATSPAITEADIYGKWCGEVNNYHISEKHLLVELKTDQWATDLYSFVIDHFERYDGRGTTGIRMWWIRNNEPVDTVFWISQEGNLVQVANDHGMGPERHFHRC